MTPEEPHHNLDEHKISPGSSFDVQYAICKETNLDEDPEEAIIRRLIKFHDYNRKI